MFSIRPLIIVKLFPDPQFLFPIDIVFELEQLIRLLIVDPAGSFHLIEEFEA